MSHVPPVPGDHLLPDDPNAAFVGWEGRVNPRTHASTSYAYRCPREHAEAWRAHLQRKNNELPDRDRRIFRVALRWPNNSTVMADVSPWGPPPTPPTR